MRKSCVCSTCGRRYPPSRAYRMIRRGGKRRLVPTGKLRCVGECNDCTDRMIDKLIADLTELRADHRGR